MKRAYLLFALLLMPVSAEAQKWGAFQAGDCTGIGKRLYFSRLWNIPLGRSWEDACTHTPATIKGTLFNSPSRCVNKGLLGEWGEFDVPDSSCPHWGDFQTDVCSAIGKRQHSARLWDIASGLSRDDTCKKTPAIVDGVPFAAPARCKNEGIFGEWGEFDLNDSSCPHWDQFGTGCDNGHKTYKAQLLDIPAGMDWTSVCNSTPATIHGVFFPNPEHCAIQGVTGVFGTFLTNEACTAPPPGPTTVSVTVIEDYLASLSGTKINPYCFEIKGSGPSGPLNSTLDSRLVPKNQEIIPPDGRHQDIVPFVADLNPGSWRFEHYEISGVCPTQMTQANLKGVCTKALVASSQNTVIFEYDTGGSLTCK